MLIYKHFIWDQKAAGYRKIEAALIPSNVIKVLLYDSKHKKIHTRKTSEV